MASPIPLPIRQAILERMRLHEDVATIAHTLHLCPRTVRNLIRRFRQQPQAIDPSYRAGSGRGQRCQALYDRVLAGAVSLERLITPRSQARVAL